MRTFEQGKALQRLLGTLAEEARRARLELRIGALDKNLAGVQSLEFCDGTSLGDRLLRARSKILSWSLALRLLMTVITQTAQTRRTSAMAERRSSSEGEGGDTALEHRAKAMN